MKRKTIAIIIAIIIFLIILILLFIKYNLNNEKNENIVQNTPININNKIEENSTKELDLKKNENLTNNTNIEEEKENMKLNIKIRNKNFTATLYNNETVKTLLEKLPLSINMNELHGNEKYYYFNENLPMNSQKIENINEGDLMLYGSNCLVIFYKSFSTSYSYTKIGHIDNTEGLEETLGNGNVEVTLQVK